MMPTTTSHAGAGSELTLPAFGLIEPERVLAADDLFAVVSDKFPVSPGHTLVIPRRALTRFQELKASEKLRLLERVDWAQSQQTLTPTPEAFNLGVNDGKAAGQTMSQFHFHIIPRHIGDIADPRGGVRWVIPAKAKYW